MHNYWLTNFASLFSADVSWGLFENQLKKSNEKLVKKKLCKTLKHCFNNECSLVLTNDIEASTDGEGWICVNLTNVLAGVRLLKTIHILRHNLFLSTFSRIFWPSFFSSSLCTTNQEIFDLWYYCSFICFHLLLVQISELYWSVFWLHNVKFESPKFSFSWFHRPIKDCLFIRLKTENGITHAGIPWQIPTKNILQRK